MGLKSLISDFKYAVGTQRENDHIIDLALNMPDHGLCCGCGRECGPDDQEGPYFVCRGCDDIANYES